MEAQEESAKQSTTMIKGKRTKRPRASSVISHLLAPSTTSSAENGVVSPASSSDNTTQATSTEESTTVEEKDMAHCLILLAQGRHDQDLDHDHQPIIKHVGLGISSNNPNDVVYQCKTCDRCFPSFQALGGHRASHKKPKPASSQAITTSFDDHHQTLFATSTALSLGNIIKGNNGNNGAVKVSKVHECSICGAEFTSGQALGGHMRRHRTASFINPATSTVLISSSTNSSESSKKSGSRSVLELDLNLPAPEEERATKFPFAASGGAGKEQVIVFSASPLVDCHY